MYEIQIKQQKCFDVLLFSLLIVDCLISSDFCYCDLNRNKMTRSTRVTEQKETRNCGSCAALQLEGTQRHAICFQLQLRGPYQVWSLPTYPIPLVMFLLLIRYVTLWPWSLTLWPWTIVVYRLWCDQILYLISAKSINPRLSYSNLKIENWGLFAILDWIGSGF